MDRDLSVFVEPGFWVAFGLLFILIAAATVVIAYCSTYSVPSILG
jgi:hypothetical protein